MAFAKERPCVGYWRVIGRPCHFVPPKAQSGASGKLDARATPGILVGYDGGSGIYRIYDFDNHQIRVSRDVRFFESAIRTSNEEEFSPTAEFELEIDEFASITSVSVAESGGVSSTDYTLWSSTDYFTEPYNATNKGKPIHKLVVDGDGTKSAFDRYRKSVKVIGIAGYSTTVHPIIAQATRIQAVRWFMRSRGGWQDVSGNESMGYLRHKAMTELDGDIRGMLHTFVLELQ